MAYSIITVAGNGSSQYPISFTLGFNSRTEVQCRVNNEVDGLGAPVYRALTWINDGLVQVDNGPFTPTDSLVFSRTIDKTQLEHDYSNGEAIEEINLDQSNRQCMMATHEIFDGRFTSPFQSDINLGNHKIINLAPGTAGTDAVNLTQLNSATAGISTVIDTVTAIANSAAGYAVSNRWTFDTSTTIADPGTGKVRFNNATIASVTSLALSETNADLAALAAWIAAFDDSNHSPKGYLTFRKDATNFVIFGINGALTDNGTWVTLPVSYVAGMGSIANTNSVYVGFVANGNDGANGTGTGDFSTNFSSGVDGELILQYGTAGKTGKRGNTFTGILKAAAGVVAAAVAGTDYAGVGNSQTFTGAQLCATTALTSSSASIATNLALNNVFTHTLTENTTLANPTNAVIGQSGSIQFTNHASSPKTLAYGSNWKFPGGSIPTLTASNSAKDTLFYNVRSSTVIEANLVKGFA